MQRAKITPEQISLRRWEQAMQAIQRVLFRQCREVDTA